MHTNPKFVAKTCCQTRKYTSGQFRLNLALRLIQQVILLANVRQLGLNLNYEKQKSFSERNWNIPKRSLNEMLIPKLVPHVKWSTVRPRYELKFYLHSVYSYSWSFNWIELFRNNVLTGVNFANILQANFSHKSVLAAFSSYMYSLCLYFWGKKNISKKVAHKMLLRLTTKNGGL